MATILVVTLLASLTVDCFTLARSLVKMIVRRRIKQYVLERLQSQPIFIRKPKFFKELEDIHSQAEDKVAPKEMNIVGPDGDPHNLDHLIEHHN